MKLRTLLSIKKKFPLQEKNLRMSLRKVLRIISHRTKHESTYFGVRAMKNPLDFWVYQEIIFDVKPSIIIEIGTSHGGSTLALAHFQDLMNKGRVIALDLNHAGVPQKVKDHPRITFITGDACESYDTVKNLINENDTVLIIEDSSHLYENTLSILRKYNSLVAKGSYFIVEDSIVNHGLPWNRGAGPYEAIEQFIKENDSFEIDRSKESFLVTNNPKGYLKKIEGNQHEDALNHCRITR